MIWAPILAAIGATIPFEDLNGRRRPMPRLLDAEVFRSEIVEALSPVVNGLGNRRIRRRLLDTIEDANRPTLEDRLTTAFATPPVWLTRVQDHMRYILGHITKRRNQLSHGDPLGAVLNQLDGEIINVEIDLIFLFCLTELLLLANISESEAVALARSSEQATLASWRAGKIVEGRKLAERESYPR